MSQDNESLGSEILSVPSLHNPDDGPLECLPQKKIKRLLRIDVAARALLVAGNSYRQAYANLVEAYKPD